METAVIRFEVAGEPYGIEAALAVEVVPAVALRPVPGTVPSLAGLLRYRGRIVPVVDLSLAWVGRASARRLSTRIVVCDLPGSRPSRLGVLAERVTDVVPVDPTAAESSAGPRTPGARGLGRLARHGSGLIQLVHVADLVPADVLATLEREEGDAS